MSDGNETVGVSPAKADVRHYISEIKTVLCDAQKFTSSTPQARLEPLLKHAIEALTGLALQKGCELEEELDQLSSLVTASRDLPVRLARAHETLETLRCELDCCRQSQDNSELSRDDQVANWYATLDSIEIEDLKSDVLRLIYTDQRRSTISLLAYAQLFDLLPRYHRIRDRLDEHVADTAETEISTTSTDGDFSKIRELASESPPRKLLMTRATLLPPIYKGRVTTSSTTTTTLSSTELTTQGCESDDVFAAPALEENISKVPSIELSRSRNGDHDADPSRDVSMAETSFASTLNTTDDDLQKPWGHSNCDEAQLRKRQSKAKWTTSSPMNDTSLDFSVSSDFSLTESVSSSSIPTRSGKSYDFLRLPPPKTPSQKPHSKALSLDQRVGKIVSKLKMQLSTTNPMHQPNRPAGLKLHSSSYGELRPRSTSPTHTPRVHTSQSATPPPPIPPSPSSSPSPCSMAEVPEAGWFTVISSSTAKKEIYCRIVGHLVMVRIGGGWQELSSFLIGWAVHHHHTPCRDETSQGRRQWAESTFEEASEQLLKCAGAAAGGGDREGRKRSRTRGDRTRSRSSGGVIATARIRKDEEGRLVLQERVE